MPFEILSDQGFGRRRALRARLSITRRHSGGTMARTIMPA